MFATLENVVVPFFMPLYVSFTPSRVFDGILPKFLIFWVNFVFVGVMPSAISLAFL